MYQHNTLDSPPPTSRFRRPWSPDPYDPLPPTQNSAYNNDDDYWESTHPESHQYHQQRREPSDVSIEALDLADYARTLRPHRPADPYPAFNPPNMYHPSPRPLRPLASPDSLHPPSLISRGGTLSTESHAHSSASRTSRTSRRPFSLPPPAHHSDTFLNRSFNSPHVAHSPPPLPHAEPEIDISQFPSWSRGWYDSKAIKNPSPYFHGDYPFPPKAHSDSHRSPFDPGFPTLGQSYPMDLRSYPAFSSEASTRDLLPWSSEPPDHAPPIDPETKEERMRMLQREFGSHQNAKDVHVSPYKDADGRPIIGSVSENGKLVTQGPIKRVVVRVLQIMLALTAAIPSIYAAVVIKSTTGTPPPAAKPAAYVLYVLSVITTLALFYLVIIRPCCCSRKKPNGAPGGPLAGGMMVLPVQRLPGGKGGKNNKGGKKGKKGPHGGPAGDLQVNLIVDPNAFRGQDEDSNSEEGPEDEFGEGSIPGGYNSQRRSRPRRRPRRQGVFAGLAMEEQWKVARALLKKIFLFDMAGIVLWGGMFVFILIGKRCPSGSFNGWCNAYNVSSAAACLLCVMFGFSTFFDIKDLHASKVSPRTRT